jgi:hypothetical protein
VAARQSMPPAHTCRDWAFVFGGIAMLMSLLPGFRNFRLFSFTALVATTFTAWVSRDALHIVLVLGCAAFCTCTYPARVNGSAAGKGSLVNGQKQAFALPYSPS